MLRISPAKRLGMGRKKRLKNSIHNLIFINHMGYRSYLGHRHEPTRHGDLFGPGPKNAARIGIDAAPKPVR
jgi:hypothetical protein